MKKILLVGSSGAGKSTIANLLSNKFNYPVLFMDIITRDDGTWNRLQPNKVEAQIHTFLQHESWIIDGLYSKYCYKERTDDADTIIFLDIPTLTSLYRCLRRQHLALKGKEIRHGALESQNKPIRAKFIYYLIWKYPRYIRKQSLQFLQKHYPDKLVVLKNQKDIDSFLQSALEKNSP